MEKLRNIIRQQYKYILIFLLIIIAFLARNRNLKKKLMQLAPKDYKTLKKGQKAPDFQARYVCKDSSRIRKFKLSDYIGKKKIILYFYPKDKTPFCTLQAKSFKKKFKLLTKLDYEIIGVSMDPFEKHLEAIKQYDLPFKLISDNEDREIHRKYKTCYTKQNGIKSVYRITYVINKKGFISQVILNIHPKNHAKQILEKEDIEIKE